MSFFMSTFEENARLCNKPPPKNTFLQIIPPGLIRGFTVNGTEKAVLLRNGLFLVMTLSILSSMVDSFSTCEVLL